MASLFKRDNGIYYAQFFDSNRSPKRKRLSLKTSKKRLARRKLTELEDAYVEGKFDPWASGKHGDPFAYDAPTKPKRISAEDLIERFVEAKKQEGRSDRTLETYRGIWRRFMERSGKKTAVHEFGEDVCPNFWTSWATNCG